jgi:ubiquinone/menaquinone biosynthesis C-methylase UbiE
METREIFDRMAGGYDTKIRVHNAKIVSDKIRAELSDTQDKSALDYGCGTGLVGLALADLFKSMLLVDASPPMVAQVQAKILAAHIDTASARCMDFCANPPAGISADVILMSHVLLHVPDYPLLLSRLFDVLIPGGRLLLVDFDKNENITSDLVHPGFDQPELIRLLRRIGFADAKSHTFYRGPKLFMNEDASLFFLIAAKQTL